MVSRETGALGVISLALALWMMAFMEQELALPLKGSFWGGLPDGEIELANSFLPQSVLWPRPATLAILAATAAVFLWLTSRALKDPHPTPRGAAVLLGVLSFACATGIVIGDGSRHYLGELTDIRTVTATVAEVVSTPCSVRSKGHYAVRTVVVFDPPTPWGSHLWVNPGLAWMEQVASLERGARVRLRGGRDAQGLGLLLGLPERAQP